MCKDARQRDNKLKTQLRFGNKDVEVFLKIKGEKEGYKKVELFEFLDIRSVPSFDHSLTWKTSDKKPARRKLVYRRKEQSETEDPSNKNDSAAGPSLQRQLSTRSDRSEYPKKQKISAVSSDSSDSSDPSDIDEDMNKDVEEAEMEIFTTPEGRGTSNADKEKW